MIIDNFFIAIDNVLMCKQTNGLYLGECHEKSKPIKDKADLSDKHICQFAQRFFPSCLFRSQFS